MMSGRKKQPRGQKRNMGNEIDIQYHTDELMADLELKKEKALVMVGMECEGDAKIEIESAPRRVDTGRLRNSITWATLKENSEPDSTEDNKDAGSDDGVKSSQAEENAVIIGTNVEYAAEIHEGKPGLDPNRFLRNAVERNNEKYRTIIDETLKGE